MLGGYATACLSQWARAFGAEEAARRGDQQTLRQRVRSLNGTRRKAGPPGVNLKDGSPAKDPQQARRRWQEHFKELMRGSFATVAGVQAKAAARQEREAEERGQRQLARPALSF